MPHFIGRQLFHLFPAIKSIWQWIKKKKISNQNNSIKILDIFWINNSKKLRILHTHNITRWKKSLSFKNPEKLSKRFCDERFIINLTQSYISMQHVHRGEHLDLFLKYVYMCAAGQVYLPDWDLNAHIITLKEQQISSSLI